MRALKVGWFAIIFWCLCDQAAAEPCNYKTWDWDTVQKKSVNHRAVTKLKSELTAIERGETAGCSVCEEDQTQIDIPSLPPFRVCKLLAEKFHRALNAAKAQGFPINSLVGYRVGKSKGSLDSRGLRTEFSNHSYGTAIDINSEKNGLYDSCVKFGPGCKLLRGGIYKIGVPGTITSGSPIYKAFAAESLKWGGEISGKQKDFMHFSLTGM